MSSEEIKVAVMQEQIIYIKDKIDDIAQKLDNKYVTIEKFSSLEKRTAKIESVLSKLNWVVIVAVLGAVLSLVIIEI